MAKVEISKWKIKGAPAVQYQSVGYQWKAYFKGYPVVSVVFVNSLSKSSNGPLKFALICVKNQQCQKSKQNKKLDHFTANGLLKDGYKMGQSIQISCTLTFRKVIFDLSDLNEFHLLNCRFNGLISKPLLKLVNFKPKKGHLKPKLKTLKVKVSKKFNLGTIKLMRSDDIETNPGPNIYSESYNVRGNYKSCEVEAKYDDKKLIQLCGDIESNPGPMILLESYNVRGLRSNDKLKRILNHAHKLNSFGMGVISLQETYLDLADKGRLDLMWRGKYVLAPGTHNSCGVILLFTCQSFDNIIHENGDDNGRTAVLVADKNDIRYMFVAVYGPSISKNSVNYYEDLFDKINMLKNQYQVEQIIIMGDLNCTLSDSDQVNRTTNLTEIKIRETINNNCKSLNLGDLFAGHDHKFTWMRGKTLSRLDYILGPSTLVKDVEKAQVKWNIDKSDHGCVQISIKEKLIKGPGLVRCRVYLLDNPEHGKRFEQIMDELMSQANPEWNPHVHLEYLKMSIRSAIKEVNCLAEYNRVNILNIKQDELEALKIKKQDNIVNKIPLDNQLDKDIASLEIETDELLELESKRLAEVVRINWLEKGEKSNKYFLNLLKRRENQKAINKLCHNGEIAHKQKDIEAMAQLFYKELYGKKENKHNKTEYFNNIDISRITKTESEEMDKQITEEELETVLKSCKDSAPGPDGIQYSLYKKTWKHSAKILLKAWEYSMETGLLPDGNRCSVISLLEKKGKDPTQIKNLRPISLTNCDLKIFTKLISNRLNKILNKVLYRSQSAYLPGRQIQDNLRLLDVILETARRNKDKVCLVALDAAKAFDSVDHEFMYECLRKYGFSEESIKLVRILYNQVEAKIMINGFLTERLQLQRGVKQGDALSCGLFILCMDPLIRRIEGNNRIPNHVIQGISCDKTAAYADDITIITSDNENVMQEIVNEYQTFSDYSGLCLNGEKTEILSINRDSEYKWIINISNAQTEIKNSDKVKICGKTFDYGGATNIDIVDKINKLKGNLNSWKCRQLTIQGRILLAKTFGLSQIIYIMQNQVVPKVTCNEIEKILFDFIWFKKQGKKSIHLISKEKLKMDYIMGGLKAPDVELMSITLQIKHLMRVHRINHSYGDLIRNKQNGVLRRQNFRLTGLSEFIDTSIGNLNNLISNVWKNVRSKTDEDEKINRINYEYLANLDIEFWLESTLKSTVVNRLVINYAKKLKSKGVATLFEMFKAESEQQRICLEFKSIYRACGSLAVAKCKERTRVALEVLYFPVNSARFVQWESTTTTDIKNAITGREVDVDEHEESSMKFKNYRKITGMKSRQNQYKILHNKIFTNERLFKFKLIESEMCNYCENSIENLRHVLYDCERAKIIWDIAKDYIGLVPQFDEIVYGVSDKIMNNIIAETNYILCYDREKEINHNVVAHKLNTRLKDLTYIAMRKCKLNLRNK